MIVVVADNPSMGAAYRMADVLRPLAKDRQVNTVVKQLDGFREWPADIVVNVPVGDDRGEGFTATAPTGATEAAASTAISNADWLLLMGKTGLDLALYYRPWPFQPTAIYHVESFYRGELAATTNERTNGLAVGETAVFAMPDLWAGGQCPPGTIPLLQPMIVGATPPVKTPDIGIVHSPGTLKKAKAKGTATIEAGVLLAERALGAKLFLEVLYDRSHAEVLNKKAIAHICIDQVPPDEYPAGLGNSGCEGLALACYTISRYQVDTSAHFPNPPVAYAENEEDVAHYVTQYTRWPIPLRQRARQRAWAWARNTLSYGPWLRYFYWNLPPHIRERCAPPEDIVCQDGVSMMDPHARARLAGRH